jgi:hypothetical protein
MSHLPFFAIPRSVNASTKSQGKKLSAFEVQEKNGITTMKVCKKKKRKPPSQ